MIPFDEGRMGVHILLNLEGCKAEALENKESVENVMLKAASYAGLHVLSRHAHQFEPSGVTGFLLLSESHLSIHTWPEHGSAAIDIFCCFLAPGGKKAALEKAEKTKQQLVDLFKAKETEEKIVVR